MNDVSVVVNAASAGLGAADDMVDSIPSLFAIGLTTNENHHGQRKYLKES